MKYCGIAVGPELQYLCTLEEVREEEPPVRLRATFYEPGAVEPVAAAVRELEEAVVAIAGPITRPRDSSPARVCDEGLRERGVPPQPPLESGRRLSGALTDLGLFTPEAGETEGPVGDGSFREAAVVETNSEGVFCALQGARLPAKRHPLGIQLRIDELMEDHIVDERGDLWCRRIDEIDAAAAALAAHRYAVGHACWVGDAAEGVIVLPGSRLPDRFTTEGVIPPVERVPLPSA